MPSQDRVGITRVFAASLKRYDGADVAQASLDSMIRALAAVSKRVKFTIETQGRVKKAVHTARAEWVRGKAAS